MRPADRAFMPSALRSGTESALLASWTRGLLKSPGIKLDIEVEVADERLRRLLEETDIDKLAAHLEQRLPTT
jgi:hypothetical protein